MPVASAEKSFRSPVPMVGRTAMVKNTMPIPPIQCVRLRQNKMDGGRLSMFVSTVAPVVVKPDMISKKAAATRVSYPPTSRGSMPTAVNTTQVIETMR